MASRQAPKSTPGPTSTMGIKGSGTSNLSSHGKNMALPTGSNTLGLKGGTHVGSHGNFNPNPSIPVGAEMGQSVKGSK
jgi:hypothetical protein